MSVQPGEKEIHIRNIRKMSVLKGWGRDRTGRDASEARMVQQQKSQRRGASQPHWRHEQPKWAKKAEI